MDDSSHSGDILARIAADVRTSIERRYYDVRGRASRVAISLRKAIEKRRGRALIAEVKFASPAHGTIRATGDPRMVARQMVAGGAVALSVLTEPTHFGGHVENLRKIRPVVRVPLLMKDFVLAEVQLQAAQALGADAVLLIASLFERQLCDLELPDMIRRAHKLGLEVLLEAYTQPEFERGLSTDADVLGINNRNLDSMSVDLANTERILRACDPRGRLVVSESGIETPADIKRLKAAGAHAFLCGTVIMRASNVEQAVRRLVTGS